MREIYTLAILLKTPTELKGTELMKISQDVVKALAKAAREHGVGDTLEGPNNTKIQAFFLEDFTVSFSVDQQGKTSFHGLSFEVLGKEFTVIPSLELLVSLPSDDGEDEEAYELDEEAIVKHIELYLLWRKDALEKYGI